MNVKKTALALILLILYFPISILIWSQSYVVINKIDVGIYTRYATNNEYNEDIFLNEEIDKKTHVYDTIRNALKNTDFNTSKTKQDIYQHIWKNKDLLYKSMSQNNEYITYLKTKKLTLDNFFDYVKKMTNLDQTLLNGCLYLVALLEILIFYYIFKYRIRIYLLAFFIYTFANLNLFTLGIFGNSFFPLMQLYFHLIHDDINYKDYSIILESFLPIIKEALLTYIIIDVVGQHFKEKKELFNSKKINHIYFSINKTLETLRLISIVNNSIKIKIKKIDFYFLYKYCKKNKKKNSFQNLNLILEREKSYLINQEKSLNIELVIELLELLQKHMKTSFEFLD